MGFSPGAAMGRDFANRVATRLQEQAGYLQWLRTHGYDLSLLQIQ